MTASDIDLKSQFTALPNPGSDEAIALGCICPVLDNGHGRGPGPFWQVEGCPVHSWPPEEANDD